MKDSMTFARIFAVVLSTIIISFQLLYADVTKTVGATGADYSTLKLAFDAINAGAINSGTITLQIIDNTTETSSATLNASGTGSCVYSSVHIYPTSSGLTISGNLITPILYLSGADNVIVDGRVNATGTTKDLTITNTNTSSGAVIIRFVNSAESNILKYCILKASPNSIGTGILYFTGSAAGNGNNNNIVEYCDITSNNNGRPSNAVFSSGTSGRENRYNIIRNNNFYNVLNPSSYSYTINISNSSSDWIISNNSFYETTTLIPLEANKYYPIFLNTGNNHLVDNNFFGGTEPECGGSAMTINSSLTHYYAAMYVNGGLTNKSIISNNVIRNINYTSTNSNPWDGIYINSGNVDVIGNIIGAETGTGSITINTPVASATAVVTGGVVTAINLVGGGSGYTVAPAVTFSTAGSTTPATATANLTDGAVTSFTVNSGGVGYTSVPIVSLDGASYSTSHGMIQNSAGIVNINNNKTGSITTVGSTTYSHGFESIYVRTLNTSAITNITSNLYGSLTTPNSIYTSSTAANSPQKQDVYGIYSSSVGTTTITGNTVANLTNGDQGTNSGSKTRGIQTLYGSNIIQNNTVRNLSSSSGSNGKKSSAPVVGISQTSTTTDKPQVVNGNTIYDISNTTPTLKTNVIGIYYSGPPNSTNSVSGNFLYNLSAQSTDILSEIDGIVLFNGLTTTANNIINIGGTINKGYLINGIWDEGNAASNNSIYYNTILIDGTVSSGATSNTAALWNNYNGSIRNYRNNLFVNNRSAGTSGKHFSIFLAGLSNTIIDYNDYYCPNGLLGKISTLEKSTFALWQAATSQDVNSANVSPQFSNQGGITIEDYYISATLAGVSGTGITTDYSNISRNSTPKMGALETSNFTWQGAVSTDFATAGNWVGGIVPTDGADITMAATPNNHCILDQNRIIKTITNGQSSKRMVLNGKKLTLTGNLNFTNGAQIDATAAESHIEMKGTASQSFPTGAFVNNTIDSLSINNASGFTLNGDFTIVKGIALQAGNFNIGPNTLTFNGIVTAMNGSVMGGPSTNMIIGGSGGSISMPEFTLNNLTINRTSGVNLYGDLNIVGTLTLTNGTVTVGSNTLTIATNAPVVTSGNIDASDANASVVFTNTSAIILPANLFENNTIQNLRINSTGGITSLSDLTVNGILNLQSGNPSATKGSLDMWDGSAMKILTMGADATTIGIGDVTGIIRRTSFVPNVVYTFGNPYTTVTFPNTGTMPTNWEFKVKIGTAPSWKTTAIQRTYDIVRAGGTGSYPTVKFHYKDSELNGNDESHLVFFGYLDSNESVNEYGRINSDVTNNWVSLSGTIEFAPTAYGEREWTLSQQEAASFTWQGTVPGLETDWTQNMNWIGGVVPTSTSDVHIPSGCANYPNLPTTVSVNSINIESGAIVNAPSTSTITINGGNSAWFNRGTFNPGSSNVVFTNAVATMSGETNFHDITINTGASLTLTTNCHINIAGSITNNGTLDATEFPNTVDYSGSSQTVVNPNGATGGFYNLLLSGSGTKTMPATALTILNNLTITDETSVTSASEMTVVGDVNITENATWNTGNFNHIVRGDFFNFGTFTATTGKSITFMGIDNQINSGGNATNFSNLILNNEQHLSLFNNININEELTLTAGNIIVNEHTLGINGTITRGTGHIEVSPASSLSFGGTDAIVLNDNLFANSPTIKNLTINRLVGVTLGNQSLTVTDSISLANGTLSLASNSLTMSGYKITSTSGSIDASNANASIEFANTEALVLPASIFSTSVNNLKISGNGGVTSPSDFTVNGILNLESVNPSATKGVLDLWDNTEQKTLTMGAIATTVGAGDATGIIRRIAFSPNTAYTFGNQYSFITFDNGGTLPTEVKFKVNIGTAPSWKPNAILRSYDLVRTGGAGCTASLSAHYLDSELNGISEEQLVLWNYTAPSTTIEYGSATHNSNENWITINYVNFLFFPTAFGEKGQSLGSSILTSNIWDGSDNNSWEDWHNWSGNVVPNSTANVIIPDASTTLFSPIISESTEIKTLSLESNAVLSVSGSPTLTINGANGAWSNLGGIFNPATGAVAFSNSAATISGSTDFYNVNINTNSTLWMTSGSEVSVSGAVSNSGTWRTVISGQTTVNYKGENQSVIVPNTNTNRYYNLTLSGSGTKTLPATALQIVGDMSLAGSATATTANDLTIGGNLNISNTANLTIETSTAVNVNGSINNSAGDNGLYIKSGSAAPNGSLTFKNTFENPVQATVEMYSKASKPTTSYKWQYFGIPLRSTNTLPSFYGSYVRRLNEAGSGGGGFEPTRLWVQLTESSTLSSFTGYEITQTSPKTIYFSGILENRNYNSDQLAYTIGAQYPGQHLIGNPYTAAIDISKIEFGTTDAQIIENTVYLFNTGSFDDWTSAGPVSTIESNLAGQYIAIPVNVANRVEGLPSQIPSMQAFLVKVKSASEYATVNIPYGSVGTVVKNTTQLRSKSITNISTQIELKGEKFSDKVWLITDPQCTSGYDNGWDGYKIIGSSSAPQLFASENAGRFQVNSRDDIVGTVLSYIINQSQYCTLKFTHQNLSEKYESLYLFDMYENKYINISATGTEYSFYATNNTVAQDRFKIVSHPGVTTNIDNKTAGFNIFSFNNKINIINHSGAIGIVTVYDSTGKLVLEKQLSSEPNSIIETQFETGIYIVKITDFSSGNNFTQTIEIKAN